MKKKIRLIGSVLLLLLVILGVTSCVSSLVSEDKNYNSVVPLYKVGSLSLVDGKPVDSTNSIYTYNSFKANSVKINVKFFAHADYQIFWYDKYDNLITTSDISNKNTTFQAPDYNCSFRLVVKPQLKDTNEIKWYNVNQYSNYLSIKVNKVDEPLLNLVITSTSSTVNDFEIVYEKGMTWKEWFDSEYNDTELIINENDSICLVTDRSYGIYLNGSIVYSKDLISSSSYSQYQFR